VAKEEHNMDYIGLSRAVASDAALRRRQRLQPAGGKGDKIFPPTYPEDRRGAGPRHVYERRRIDGAEVWCVLVDSVQSQANRLEEALLAAFRDGSITLPHVTVDFTGKELAGVGEITSLDAPHRVYDAILRDSLLDGQPFMKSPLGLRLAEAKPGDATALLEASPTALLFGSVIRRVALDRRGRRPRRQVSALHGVGDRCGERARRYAERQQWKAQIS
jgi:CRISPR-associated protein Csb1